MKKKFVEISFDGVNTFEFPLEWFNHSCDDKRYFILLGIYEKEVDENVD